MEILPGDLLLVGSDITIFARAIKFVSRSKWSHTAIGAHVSGMLFEAALLICLTDWRKTRDNPNLTYRLYRWTDLAKQVAAGRAAERVFDKYNTNLYGIMMLPWYIWRAIVERLHLPQGWAAKHNFFPAGEVCTEIKWRAFEEMIVMPEFSRSALAAVTAATGQGADTVWPPDIEFVAERLRECGELTIVDRRE